MQNDSKTVRFSREPRSGHHWLSILVFFPLFTMTMTLTKPHRVQGLTIHQILLLTSTKYRRLAFRFPFYKVILTRLSKRQYQLRIFGEILLQRVKRFHNPNRECGVFGNIVEWCRRHEEQKRTIPHQITFQTIAT